MDKLAGFLPLEESGKRPGKIREMRKSEKVGKVVEMNDCGIYV